MPRGPGPDETAFVLNTFMARGADGEWTFWLEPLDRSERELVTTGPDFEEARRRYTLKVIELLNTEDEAQYKTILADYAVQVRAGDVPPVTNPPAEGYRRTIDTLVQGTYERVASPVSAPEVKP